MINKKEIDTYFTNKHKEITLYIKKSFSKHRVYNEDPSFFLSEIYLYIIKKQEELETEKDLKNYISTFIHNHCYWVNSKIREKERYNRRIKLESYDITNHDYSNEQDSLQQEEEFQINEYQTVVDMYYSQLRSLEKKAIWEIYFIEGHTTYKSFARYINMSKTVSAKLIKELKFDLNNYYKEYVKDKDDI